MVDHHQQTTVTRAVLSAATHYAALGLPVQLADYNDVRQAYKQRALLVHPDKQTADTADAADAHKAFQKISLAFETLASEASQRIYFKALPAHLRKSASTSSSSASAVPTDHDASPTTRPSLRKRRSDREWWEQIDIDAIDESLSKLDADLKEEIERQRVEADERLKRRRALQAEVELRQKEQLHAEIHARAQSGTLDANMKAWSSWRSSAVQSTHRPLKPPKRPRPDEKRPATSN